MSDFPAVGYDSTGRLNLRSMILREMDSVQYHIAGSFLRKIVINLAKSYQNQKYFNPLVSGPGRLE